MFYELALLLELRLRLLLYFYYERAYISHDWDLHVHAMENTNSQSTAAPFLHSPIPLLICPITLPVKE